MGPFPEKSSSLNMAGVISSENQDSSAITPSRYRVRVSSSFLTQFQKCRMANSSLMSMRLADGNHQQDAEYNERGNDGQAGNNQGCIRSLLSG